MKLFHHFAKYFCDTKYQFLVEGLMMSWGFFDGISKYTSIKDALGQAILLMLGWLTTFVGSFIISLI